MCSEHILSVLILGIIFSHTVHQSIISEFLGSSKTWSHAVYEIISNKSSEHCLMIFNMVSKRVVSEIPTWYQSGLKICSSFRKDVLLFSPSYQDQMFGINRRRECNRPIHNLDRLVHCRRIDIKNSNVWSQGWEITKVTYTSVTIFSGYSYSHSQDWFSNGMTMERSNQIKLPMIFKGDKYRICSRTRTVPCSLGLWEHVVDSQDVSKDKEEHVGSSQAVSKG